MSKAKKPDTIAAFNKDAAAQRKETRLALAKHNKMMERGRVPASPHEPQNRLEAIASEVEFFLQYVNDVGTESVLDNLLYKAALGADSLDFCDGEFAHLVISVQWIKRFFRDLERASNLPETKDSQPTNQ